MTELTFITFLWNGWRPVYNATHVNALARMLDANLTIPHRLVCATDDPEGIECETVPLWDVDPVVGWSKPQNSFRRLRLFDGEFAKQFGERVVCIDLDNLMTANCDDFFTDEADFKILSGVGSPYNGGLWSLKVGTNSHVWSEFDPNTVAARIDAKRPELARQGKRLIGSDQAWFATVLPNAPTWSRKEFGIASYSNDLARAPLPDWKRVQGLWERIPESEARQIAERKFLEKYRFVSFAGGVKPWSDEVRYKFPELYAAWAKHREPVSV